MHFENSILAMAPLSFAIYLIHDNPVREVLWKTIPMEKIIESGFFVTTLFLVITIIAVFIAGCGIEKSDD